jgi:hypothetical protein
MKMQRKKMIARIAIFILVLIMSSFGSLYAYEFIRYSKSVTFNNNMVINELRDSKITYVFYCEHNKPILLNKIPGIKNRSSSLGWGSLYGHGDDGGVHKDIAKTLEIASNGGTDRIIAVVAPSRKTFTEQYPSWRRVFYKNLKVIKEVTGPSIWIAYFHKTDYL